MRSRRACLLHDLADNPFVCRRRRRRVDEELAAALTTAISSHAILTSAGRTSVTVSIGVVGLDHATRERHADALVAADNAMYRAKHAGRNRVYLAA
jgi:diguanylate cyclase (GGDEF)-like protein